MNTKKKANDTIQESCLCPIRYGLDIVGGKWKLPILCMLSNGERARYSVIKRKLGDITNMMLSQSLKELEAAGMIVRIQYSEVPPRVEYSLSDKGKSIVPILLKFGQWGREHMDTDSEGERKCCSCKDVE